MRSATLFVVFAIALLHGEDTPKKITSHEFLSAVSTKIEPVYPELAKQLHLEGQVDLELTGSQGGSVEDVSTVAGNPILARAATEALRRWKFKPFTEDGKPVRISATLSFTFKH